MAPKTFVVLFALGLFAVSAQAACPSLTFNNSCNTGSCSLGGLAGSWDIPKFPGPPCSSLPCQYQGSFMISGQQIDSYTSMTAALCCSKCKKKASCSYYQYVDGVCFLYYGNGPSCSGSTSKVSKAGGKCKSQVSGDPHLVGAHGTHFEYSGLPDKSFCLLTDRSLHINMKMTGYLDERLESAIVTKNGKALRTWIREVGIMWLAEGVQHKLRLVARTSGETARGEGFLAVAEVDGQALPKMQPGEVADAEGGLTFSFQSIVKKGAFDEDYYRLQIENLLDMEVRLTVAHPLLQRPEDAETHISLAISDVKATPVVHGVLGQTYRDGREERAMQFSELSALLHKTIAADGETGKGFLDGDATTDYISTNVMIPDCKYTAFQGHVLPTAVSSE